MDRNNPMPPNANLGDERPEPFVVRAAVHMDQTLQIVGMTQNGDAVLQMRCTVPPIVEGMSKLARPEDWAGALMKAFMGAIVEVAVRKDRIKPEIIQSMELALQGGRPAAGLALEGFDAEHAKDAEPIPFRLARSQENQEPDDRE